jgi:hypothetical protein
MTENMQLLHCIDKSVNAAWENNSHLFRAQETNTELYIKHHHPPLSLSIPGRNAKIFNVKADDLRN